MFRRYVFDSDVVGKNILILGGVHGNEVAGGIAQRQIIEQIEKGELCLKSGKVTFIPCVNEKAYEADTRFVDINLNRVVCFHQNPQNNEEKIANELIKEIDNCDIMLDLHSTHCEGDQEFAFIDYPVAENVELLSLMPVENALAGWPEIYDDVDNFCSEKYAHAHGKVGITVECGYHKGKKSIDVAKKSILNVLAHYGVVDGIEPEFSEPNLINLERFVIKKTGGLMNRNYHHLSEVKKGEVLATYDNGEQVVCEFDGFIIIPNHEAEIGTEWFYLGRK